MSTFAVIDLSNLFARARYVVQGDAYDKAGMALTIVFKSLRKMHRQFSVDHMVFAIDSGSWRYDVYPLYKSGRKADRLKQTPSEKEDNAIFFGALNSLTEYLETQTRCTVLRRQGIEGDDFVARFIQNHPNDQHVLISGDSDFVQLLAPNVKIYDGVEERLIAVDGVTNAKNERMRIVVLNKSGKAGKIDSKIVDQSFVPEPEWWKQALFFKIVRGDTGDSILSSNPRVRYDGTSKEVTISQAWEDRKAKGFHWNNFMLKEWDKPIGTDSAGEIIFQKTVVKDAFALNESLIDLTKQPTWVKEQMDETIRASIHKPPVPKVGFAFLKFCKTHDLPNTIEVTDHAIYLNAPYPNQDVI